MPTYEYRCPKGHHFELFQRMSEEPRAVCPECGEESERLLSGGAGFLFKGNGFYITDYRSESYKKDASEEKSTGAAGQAQAEGGEKKPEPSPGAKTRKKPKDSSSRPSSGGDSSGLGS